MQFSDFRFTADTVRIFTLLLFATNTMKWSAHLGELHQSSLERDYIQVYSEVF